MTGAPQGTVVLAAPGTALRLVRRAGGLTLGRGLAGALSLVWLAVAARHLAFAELGDLVLLLSVGAMAAILADWGLPLVLNEAVAIAPERALATYRLVLRYRLGLGLVAVTCSSALYLAAAEDPSLGAPAVFGLSMLATAHHTTSSAALRGLGRVAPDALNEVLSRVMVLALGTLVVTRGHGILAIVTVYALADTGSAVVLSVVARRSLPGASDADRSRFARRRLAPLGIAALAGVVYYRVDMWLLAVLAGSEDVATYAVSYRLLEALLLPAGALTTVLVASIAGCDHEQAIRMVDRTVRIACLAAAPAVAVLVALASPLLRVVFGEPFGAGEAGLRILALSVLPSVAALLWAPLVALRGERLLLISVVCLGANVALNVLLIPPLGGAGAAIATVVGQVVFAIGLRTELRRLRRRSRSTIGAHLTAALEGGR